MNFIYLISLHIMLFVLYHKAVAKIRDTSQIFRARQKRYLIYEEGVNWIQMVVGVGFPIELREVSVQWGFTMYSYYLLPTNSSVILRPSINISRKGRSPSRWEIYSAIHNFMDRFNLGNGKVCLMRAICEAPLVPFDKKTGLLAEIMHALLTPSTTSDELDNHADTEYHAAEKLGRELNNCARLFSSCNFYFLKQLTKVLL